MSELPNVVTLHSIALEQRDSDTSIYRSLLRLRVPFLKVGRGILVERSYLPAIRADLACRLVERQREAVAKALRRAARAGT